MLLNVSLAAWARRLASTWRGYRKSAKSRRKDARIGVAERLERREMLTTFTVTSLDDVVGGSGDEVSLRQAVLSANENPGPDLINFSSGLIGTIHLTSGQLEITDPVTIQGNGSSNTILDANSLSRVFHIGEFATDVTLQGLTITHGNAEAGGGILNVAANDSTFAMIDCILKDNTATNQGGGLFLQPTSTFTLSNSKITGNSTTGDNASGGGIYGFNGGSLTISNTNFDHNTTQGSGSKGGTLYWYNGEITLSDSSVLYGQTLGDNSPGGAFFLTHGSLLVNDTFFFKNSTTGNDSPGGGVFIGDGGTFQFADSDFHNNSTAGQNSNGGAVFSKANSVVITGSQFTANSITGLGSNGGGLAIDRGDATIFSSLLDGNTAIGTFFGGETAVASGGAIYVNNANVILDSSTLLDNSVKGSGAGIYGEFGSLRIQNSTISGNTGVSGSSKGGGIGAYEAAVTVDSSTIVNNQAGTSSSANSGGGIFSTNGFLDIHNSIVAKNTGGLAPDIRPPLNAYFAVRNSLIGSNAGSSLTPSAVPDSPGNLIGTSAAPIDPLLQSLTSFGTTSASFYPLQPNSPAINRGDDVRATAWGLTVDQRGRDRIVGSATDMGSFEVQAPVLQSIVRTSGATNPTSSASVNFTVNFSEDVTGLTSGNFSADVSGTVVAGPITVTAVNAHSYTVSVNGVSGLGTLGLIYNNIGNVRSTTTTLQIEQSDVHSSESFSIVEAPVLVVQSIGFPPGATSPTLATSVSFKITFSSPVNNVAASQFQVIKTGTVVSGAPQLSGSGKDYTVTVSGITGAGTLGLNFQNDGTVVRISDGQPMTQPSFTGAVYEIQQGTQGAADLDVGGLRFHVVSGGNFTTSGALNSVAGQVQVGFVPSGGGTFTPLASLSGTVTVNSSTQTFSATGDFKSIIGNVERTLFQNGVSNLSISELTGAGISLGGGSPLTVAGGSFILTTFGFDSSPTPAITFRGRMTLPKGITIAVEGSNFVRINSSGISLTGASFTLTNSFTVAGVTFSANELTLNYNSTINEFRMTGTAGVTVQDIANLSVNFTGTGLVIRDGVFSSIDATVNGLFQVKGVKVTPTDLHFKFAESTQQFSMSGGASVEITGFETTIGVTFGSQTSPGVVITNGTLTSLDMTVNATFKVAKVTIAAQNLKLTYAAGTFTLAGTAKATVTGLGDLSVQFGDGSTPGMVVTNGSVTSLDMAITAQFQVASVKINADSLRLIYTAAENTYALTGTAGLVIAGLSGDQPSKSLSVTFGFGDLPGAVITNGQLVSLDFTVNATFEVAKVAISGENLRLQYTAATSTFALTGTAGVQISGVDGATPGDSVSVTFGSDDSPGLVIESGSLSSLDMIVNGQFTVAQVGITAEDLELNYVASTSSFSLSGTAAVAIGGLGNISVQFGDGTAPGMVVEDGVLKSLDMIVTATFDVASVNVTADELRLIYEAEEDKFSLTGTAAITLAGISSEQPGDSLSVTFGFEDTPGMVVTNGELQSLDLTVNATFEVAQVAITGESLRMTYDAAASAFTLAGTATIQVSGIEGSEPGNSLSVTFGEEGSPGIVIENGELSSLEMTVNAAFEVAGVSITAEELQFTYDAATTAFTMTGTAGIQVIGIEGAEPGNSLSVTFGGDDSPGIVIENGALSSLDMTVNAAFDVASVSITAEELHFTYDAATDAFTMSGTAGIAISGVDETAPGKSLSVTFGSDDTEGLVIENGSLVSLDMTVNGQFSVAQVGITAQDLHLTYVADTETFNLGGTAKVAIGGLGDLSVQFGDDTTPGMVIEAGVLSSLDMTINAQFEVAKVKVNADNLRITYDAETESFTLAGTAGLVIAGISGNQANKSLSATFGFEDQPGLVITNGELESLDLTINATFEVQKVSIKADNLRFTYDAESQSFSLSGTASVKIGGVQGTGTDNGLSATFGQDGAPGLVITNGALSSLDITINAGFTVAKVQMEATDLRFTYTAATSSFTLRGTAGIKVGGIEGAGQGNSLSATFGFQGSAGLVIENGALRSLDITINANFKVAKVQINATNLRFTFNAATNAFTLSGTAGIKVEGIQGPQSDNSLSATFGFQGSPGLVIENGVLRSLDITINATFNVARVQVKATNLRFTFDAATNAFTLSGTAGIKIDGIQGPQSDNSLSVTFGYQGAPGLVIENGALRSLDITINATFNVAKVQVKATDLRFTYDAATSSFTLSGTAGIIVSGIQGAGLDNSFSVTFGYHGAPGIVVENGQLRSLDITVNATLNITQVQLKLTDVRFTYTAATNSFTLAGTAGVVVRNLGADLSITFGFRDANGVQQPGLVINNGVLDKLDMTVNAGFRVANVLQVNVRNLRFTYTRVTNQFTLSGGVMLSPVGLSDLANISASFGDVNTPGIVIQNGALVSLNFKIEASIKVSALTISGQLKLDYTRANDTVVISGAGSIAVAGIGQLSVKLGDVNTGTRGIVIVGGRLTKFDMTITTNIKLGGLTLNGALVMNYSSSTGIFTATGDVTLNIATIGNVSARLGRNGTQGLVITNGSLTSLDLDVAANFAVGPLQFTGSLRMTYQKATTRFVMSGNALGSVLGASLFSVDVGSTSAPGLIIVNGKLDTLNVKVTGTFTVVGIRLGNVSVTAKYEASRNRFFFSGSAGVDLPDFIPDWLAATLGGRTVASATIELNVVKNNDAESYFQAEARLLGLDFGFKRQFDGTLTFFGNPTLTALANGVVNVGNQIKDAFVSAWNWFSSWFGPLEGANVFYDANFNFDFATDPHSITGSDGRFAPVVPEGATTGQLVVVGGLDRSTGLSNPLRLTAPYMSKIVSPLTSLVNQLMQQRGLSAGDAIIVIDAALGIPVTTNLLGQSLALEAAGGDAQAARSFSREVQVGSLVHEVSSLLSGLAGAPSVAEISTHGFAAIAAMIGESGGVFLDLSDPEVVREILRRTAESVALALDSNIAASTAPVLAGINRAIDDLPLDSTATYLNRLLQIQTVAQGSIAPDLARITTGQLSTTTFINNYTGTTLTSKFNAATFGILNAIGSTVAITPLISQAVGVGEPETFEFLVTLTSIADRTQPISVHFATRDQSATVGNGDFEQTIGTLTWQPGDVAPKTISIPVHAANSDLDLRIFTVELTDVQNAEIVNSFAIGHIASSHFATTTTLTSDDTTAEFAQTVTFTATVENLDPANTIATEGAVNFFDGDELLGSSLLQNGVAVFSTDVLSGGTHTIRAVYEGATFIAEKYLPSTSNSLQEIVGRVSQSITFPSIASVTFGDAPFAIDAFTSSGLPLNFRVVSGPASINENVLTLEGIGAVVLEATQPGDENFSSATPVSRTFLIIDSGTGASNTAPVALSGTAHVGSGQTVSGQLQATDVDNDTLTFAVSIEPEHGTVLINEDGTFEYTATVGFEGVDTFTFYANDSQLISNLGTITVFVGDTNQPPVVSAVTFNIAENATFATTVGTVTVTDSDLDQTQTFSIVGGNTNDAFAIDPVTGTIRVANPAALNFEVTPTFNLTIQSTDSGNPSQSGSATITIHVIDVNEAPTVTAASFSVTENSPLNTTIGSVVATDPDVGQSRTFSIADGNTSNAFAINATTGAVTVANVAAIDFEATPFYTLTIQVIDDGSPALSDTAIITINLTNVAEQPVIGGGSGTVTYKRSQPAIKLMPGITVQQGGSSASLSKIEISYLVAKKGSLSDVNLGNAASLGLVVHSGASDFKKSAGTHTVTITLNAGVTDAQVQAFLRGISFSSKKMDSAKKPLGRKIDVRVTNREGAGTPSNLISTQVHAAKK